MKIQGGVWKLADTGFLILVVLLFSGCQRSKTEKRTKLTFAAEASATDIVIYNKVIADFEQKHPGVKVVPLYVPGNYYAKVLIMFASGTGPDVFWMGQGFGDFAQRGVLLDLDKEIDPSLINTINSFAPQVLNLYRYHNKLMGLPTGINVPVLVYNVTLFDRAGLKYPDENWDTNDLLAAAQALTRDTNNDGRTDQFGIVPSGIWYKSFGGSVLSRDGERCELTSSGSVSALTFAWDLVNKYRVAPKQVGGATEGFADQSPFLTGKVGMTNCLDIALNSLQKSIKNFEWDVAPIPCQKKKEYWASSSGFCISAHTGAKKEAIAFLHYLASDPYAQKMMAPIAIPVLNSVAEKVISEQTIPKHLGCLLNIIQYINPTPRVPGITEIEGIARDWEDKVLLGVIKPKAGYQEAAREIDAILKKNKVAVISNH